LQLISVLELVDHEIAETFSPTVTDIRMFAQEPDREEKQIVEVDRIRGLEILHVTSEDRSEQSLFVLRRRPAIVLRAADRALRHLRIELLVARRGASDDLFDQAVLIAFVINAEVILVTEAIDPGAQDAKAERVERRHRDFLRGGGIDDRTQARSHFRGRLVCERHREDVRRIDSLGDEVSHSHRDDASLARARARQNQKRAFRGGDGAALRVVQVSERKASHRKRVTCAGSATFASEGIRPAVTEASHFRTERLSSAAEIDHPRP